MSEPRRPLPQGDAILQQQTADVVDQRRAPAHHLLPSPMQRLDVLLLDALDRHEAHVRTLDRFANRLGIARIVLGALDARSNEFRMDQPDLDTELAEPSAPMVGAEQASIATTLGASWTTVSTSLPRLTRRETTARPWVSVPCSWNTRFAKSIPSTATVIGQPSCCQRRLHGGLGGRRPFHKLSVRMCRCWEVVMDNVVCWMHASGHASEHDRDALAKGLARQGVKAEPLQRDTPQRLGVCIFGSTTPELPGFLQIVSRSGHLRVIAVAGSGASLDGPAHWDLLQAGASDVLVQSDPDPVARQIKTRFERWLSVEYLMEEPTISEFVVAKSPVWRQFCETC